MSKRLLTLVFSVLVFASLSFAAGKTFTGVVSDSGCGAKHATASDEAATCVKGCIGKGQKYVLVSKGKVYSVEPQDKFADFAGKAVKVTGTASGTSITAESVEAAPAKAKKASKKKAGM